MSTRTPNMSMDAMATVTVVMTAEPLVRGTDAVAGAAVAAASGSSALRLRLRCYGEDGEESWMVRITSFIGY